METKLQPCRICNELEASLHAAQQPDPPRLVLGLTEAGQRNSCAIAHLFSLVRGRITHDKVSCQG